MWNFLVTASLTYLALLGIVAVAFVVCAVYVAITDTTDADGIYD